MTLEEVRFLQKQRERKSGIPAIIGGTTQAAVGAGIANTAHTSSKNKNKSTSDGLLHHNSKNGEAGDGDKDDLVLQDTFAQETAVTVEDPNM